MSASTLSVIFPTYNCRNRIQRHLKKASDWLDLADEIIVVDSFSTDGTLEVIRQEIRHPGLKVISREPGLYESWNEAIQASRGDWIYISTAGDGIMRSQLLHLIETGGRLQADVVVSNARFINDDGSSLPGRECPAMKLVRAFGLKYPTVFSPATAQYLAFSLYPLAVLGSSAANAFRGSHLRARPFPLDHGHAGDTAWMLRYGHETRLCVTPVEGATYCLHERTAAATAPDHKMILLREVGLVQETGEVRDLLQRFIDRELPLLLSIWSLRDKLRERGGPNDPETKGFGRWLWTRLLLRLQRFRHYLCRSQIRREVCARLN